MEHTQIVWIESLKPDMPQTENQRKQRNQPTANQ
jgi:hypothetical protein